jgi:predicted NUDIX family phosphoesterase
MTSSALVDRQIIELERLAQQVLEIKRRSRPRRPIVIEFAGSPKAGKSTCIGSLDIFLRRNNFRTKILTERASVCPIPNKFDPIFNVWTASAALNQLSETLANSSKKLDVIILDRGFFDALCWFEWQRREKLLRNDDYQRFTNFFTSMRFRMCIDLVLVFESSPETSSEREYKNLLTRKEGSIMRREVLTSYLDTIKHTTQKYKSSFREIREYNTDDQDQNEVSYNVTKTTLDLLKNLADEKIGYIPKSCMPKVPTVFKYSEIRQSIESNLNFNDRNTVEDDIDCLQIIPIAVIKEKSRDDFLVGTKAQKATSTSSPEKGRTLCYFGGHVREEDSNLLEGGDKLDVLKQCVYREVKEEIGIDLDPDSTDPACIWVRDGSKSEHHLAVVFIVELSLSRIKLSVDGEEFARYEKKGRTGTGDIISAYELAQMKIDSWTENIVKRIADVNYQERDPSQPTLFKPA